MSDTNPTYAIIRTGGKQYKVQAGDTVRVEKLEKNLGDKFELSEILLVGGSNKTFVGQPVLQGAKVTVIVTQQAKAPKVIVFKKKRRQGYRKMQGHRQLFTELFIQSITTPEGQTITAESDARVLDPEKIAAKKADIAEKRAASRSSASGEEKSARKSVKTKAKKPVKKPRKTASKGKIAGAKKVVAKKQAGKKVKKG